MSEFELNVYQPWSVPLLHTTLPDTLLKDLIQLTDLIENDENKEIVGDRLAGEIEEEYIIDSSLLTNIKFRDYALELSKKYFSATAQNFQIVDDRFPTTLSTLKDALNNIDIVSSWFNNQRDNEYNPLHDHTGTLSGVLYLKIPEYLPPRKNEHTDGSIVFFGNEMPAAGLITNSTLAIAPKVGDIFLFASSLKHQVYPFRTSDGKGIRRSMSFNLDKERLTNE